MSIQMKNGCLVYYGNLIGYQAKNQTEVTVDPQFRREELESWLARRGLVPRWEEGVYERLSNEGFRVSDSSPELQSCRIWQLKPGTPIQMRFIGLDAMAQKFGGPTPEQYHVVYDGRIQDNDLEKLWNKFSRTPLGPDGQPLAISDVVELYNASGSTFFYLDTEGGHVGVVWKNNPSRLQMADPAQITEIRTNNGQQLRGTSLVSCQFRLDGKKVKIYTLRISGGQLSMKHPRVMEAIAKADQLGETLRAVQTQRGV